MRNDTAPKGYPAYLDEDRAAIEDIIGDDRLDRAVRGVERLPQGIGL